MKKISNIILVIIIIACCMNMSFADIMYGNFEPDPEFIEDRYDWLIMDVWKIPIHVDENTTVLLEEVLAYYGYYDFQIGMMEEVNASGNHWFGETYKDSTYDYMSFTIHRISKNYALDINIRNNRLNNEWEIYKVVELKYDGYKDTMYPTWANFGTEADDMMKLLANNTLGIYDPYKISPYQSEETIYPILTK